MTRDGGRRPFLVSEVGILQKELSSGLMSAILATINFVRKAAYHDVTCRPDLAFATTVSEVYLESENGIPWGSNDNRA